MSHVQEEELPVEHQANMIEDAELSVYGKILLFLVESIKDPLIRYWIWKLLQDK